MTHRLCYLLLALSAPLIAAGCFSQYTGDCGRDVSLQCFWDAYAACGDGQLDPGEACDDGNELDCDGCRADCSAVEAGCGDGLICGGEECDLGATNADDGECTTHCTKAACGDGFTQAGEECDHGPDNSIDADCLPECKVNHCGDTTIQPGEECDDGNHLGGDGCHRCELECDAGPLPASAAIYKDPDSLHCYARIDQKGPSFAGAQTKCHEWSGELAGFATMQEYNTVVDMLPPGKSEVWTGGNDLDGEGQFKWLNGESWLSSPPWAFGEPDNSGGENCVTIGTDGKLYTRGCGSVNGYLCERDLKAAAP